MPGRMRVDVTDNTIDVSRANPPRVELEVDKNEKLEIEAPEDSDLIVFFFPGIHVEDSLKDKVPAKLKGEYAPFGDDGKVRIKAGKTWKSRVPHKDWPRGAENPYPYRIYVEKKQRQAAGNSPPPQIILL